MGNMNQELGARVERQNISNRKYLTPFNPASTPILPTLDKLQLDKEPMGCKPTAWVGRGTKARVPARPLTPPRYPLTPPTTTTTAPSGLISEREGLRARASRKRAGCWRLTSSARGSVPSPRWDTSLVSPSTLRPYSLPSDSFGVSSGAIAACFGPL